MYLFIFLTVYIFRAHRAHHQERQTVSIQPLVAVTLCRWLCLVQVEVPNISSILALECDKAVGLKYAGLYPQEILLVLIYVRG